MKKQLKKQPIAQQLGITEFPFQIYNNSGQIVYLQENEIDWERWEFNFIGRKTLYENSDGDWTKYDYDGASNLIKIQYSSGLYQTWAYDSLGKEIFFHEEHLQSMRKKKYLIALPSFPNTKGFNCQTILVSARDEKNAIILARHIKGNGVNIGDIKEVDY